VNNLDSLVLWGERGLVAAMLVDLYRGSKTQSWQSFLEACSYSMSPAGCGIRSVSAVVEPDFSNQGFGHPDGLIKFELEDDTSSVVILEAKRLAYGKVCAPPATRGGTGYNSFLNGQLELNHCLALALSDHKGEGLDLREPDWILHSPYNSDRRGTLRSLKNQAVIEQVVRPFSGLPFRSYFHLVITTDTSNPFENSANQGFWPELYHPDYPFQNCWKELRPQFGWVSWDSVENTMKMLGSAQNDIGSSIFLPTLESNRRNFKNGLGSMSIEESIGVIAATLDDVSTKTPSATPDLAVGYRGTRGATMIFAPSINPNTFLHFSWLNESCALRDYSNSPNIMPFEDRSRRKSEVIAKIVKEIAIRNRSPISDTRYWHETTKNLNKTELTTLVQSQPVA
jgi:hypothetical protein